MAYTPEIGRRFWFELDRATKYNDDFMTMLSQAGAFGIQRDYKTTRSAGSYPAAFRAKFASRRDQWVRIAEVQTSTVAAVLGGDLAAIQAAFEDFGQGTLLDTDPERLANDDAIHTMDVQFGTPPGGYHRWHASIRLTQLLGIGDAAWWENLDRVLGLAWGIQSFARPKQQNTPNPAIAAGDLETLRTAWLALTPERRDAQYDLGSGEEGYHPKPKQPA